MEKLKVVIAGAGPGDVDLITVKTAQYLSEASYILVDRLVNAAIIDRYARADAEVIYVGKHGGHESTSQQTINNLLVEYGRKDGLTVRLKGGDVAFFSNAISEMETLSQNDIPFQVVPGITAASGASASLQLPLTARGYAHGVRLLTYYNCHQVLDLNWPELASTTDTLVFYMSSRSLPELVKKLAQFVDLDKPLAIVEQATTSEERVIITSIFKFEDQLSDVVIKQPALVILGEIVNHYREASERNQLTTLFFKEHSYAG